MDDNDPLDIPPFLDRSNPDAIANIGNSDDRPVSNYMSSGKADNAEAQSSEPESSGQADLKPHPLAEMFPRMQGKDFEDLVTSIKEDGQEEPIVTFEGKILDGRNRYAACVEAKVEPESIEYKGDDPLKFVLLKNLHRRQLQTSQRAMVACNLANMRQGDRTDLGLSANLQKVAVAEAAETLNVSPRSVETAKIVRDSGNEELIKAVKNGEVSVSAAAKKINVPAGPVEAVPNAEQGSQKLLKLWDKTGEEARKMFLEAIGESI